MEKVNAPTIPNRERQAAYKERMRLAGYVQVTLWIRKDKRGELKTYADQANKQE